MNHRNSHTHLTHKEHASPQKKSLLLAGIIGIAVGSILYNTPLVRELSPPWGHSLSGGINPRKPSAPLLDNWRPVLAQWQSSYQEFLHRKYENEVYLQKIQLHEHTPPQCHQPPKSIQISTDIEEHKEVTQKISEALFDTDTYQKALKVLVSIESEFDAAARSDTGAIGLAQLTTIVCRDMIDPVRKHRYQDTLIHLYWQGLFSDGTFSPDINHTVTLWIRDEVSWETLVRYLWNHRNEASVNVMIGGVYYSSLIQDQEKYRTVRRTETATFQKFFGTEVDPKTTEEIFRAANAASQYNGSDRILPSGKAERVVHTRKFLKRLSKDLDIS